MGCNLHLGGLGDTAASTTLLTNRLSTQGIYCPVAIGLLGSTLQLLPRLRPDNREVCRERSDWAEGRVKHILICRIGPARANRSEGVGRNRHHYWAVFGLRYWNRRERRNGIHWRQRRKEVPIDPDLRTVWRWCLCRMWYWRRTWPESRWNQGCRRTKHWNRGGRRRGSCGSWRFRPGRLGKCGAW